METLEMQIDRITAENQRLREALRESTALLGDLHNVTERHGYTVWPEFCRNQIAANEAAIGGE